VDSRSSILVAVAAACGLIYAVLVWRWLETDERNDLLAYVPVIFRNRARAALPSQAVTATPEESA
jgi:hypothetical protein